MFCRSLLGCGGPYTSKLNGLGQVDSRFRLYLTKLLNKDDCSSVDRFGSELDAFCSPLTTFGQLQRMVGKAYSRQWFDHPRSELRFFRQITTSLTSSRPSASEPLPLLTFQPPSVGSCDLTLTSGIIDWLATDAGSRPMENWVNPVLVHLVTIASSTPKPVLGDRASILGPRGGSLIGNYPVQCAGYGFSVKARKPAAAVSGPQKSCETCAWLAIDTGLQVLPSAYSLAYLRRADLSSRSLAPRNWNFEASNDAIHWTVLRRHVNDQDIQSTSGSRASWPIDVDSVVVDLDLGCKSEGGIEDAAEAGEADHLSTTSRTTPTRGWRFFRILATGPNANGSSELTLGGFELYGTICGIHEELLSAGTLAQKVLRDKTLQAKSANSSITARTQQQQSTRRFPHYGRTHQFSTPSTRSSHTDLPPPPIRTSAPRKTQHLFATTETCCLPDQMSGDLLTELLANTSDGSTSSDDDAVATTTTTVTISNAGAEHGGSKRAVSSNSAEKSDSKLLVELRRFLSGESSDGRNEDRTTTGDYDSAQLARVFDLCKLFDEPETSPYSNNNDDQQDTPSGAVSLIKPSSLVSATGSSLLPPAPPPRWLLSELSSSNTQDDDRMDTSGSLLDADDPSDVWEFAENLEAIINFNRANAGTAAADDDFTLPQISYPLSARSSERSSNKEITPLSSNELDVGETAGGSADTPSTIDRLHRRSSSSADDQLGAIIESYNENPLAQLPSKTRTTSSSSSSSSSIPTTLPLNTQQSSSSVFRTTATSARHQRRAAVNSRTTAIVSSQAKPPRPKPIVLSTNSEYSAAGQQPKDAVTSKQQPPAPLSLSETLAALRLPPGLIPAFVPSPGYTNSPATSQFTVVCKPGNETSSSSWWNRESSSSSAGEVLADFPTARIFHLATTINWFGSFRIRLDDPNRTMFSYIQELYDLVESVCGRIEQDKIDRNIDTTLAPAYRDFVMRITHRARNTGDTLTTPHKGLGVVQQTQSTPLKSEKYQFISRPDLRLAPNLTRNLVYSTAPRRVEVCSLADYPPSSTDNACTPDDLLQLLNTLFVLSGISDDPDQTTAWNIQSFVKKRRRRRLRSSHSVISRNRLLLDDLDPLDFVSPVLTSKLLRQLRDPLALCSNTLPSWCYTLTRRLPALFSFEARLEFLKAAAFGPARSLIWIQNQPPSHPPSSLASSPPITPSELDALSRCISVVSSGGAGSISTAATGNTNNTTAAAHTLVSSSTNTITAQSNESGPSLLNHLLQSLAASDLPNPEDQSSLDMWTCFVSAATAASSSLRSRVEHGGGTITSLSGSTLAGQGVARLHKEFVRLPRLPTELLGKRELAATSSAGSGQEATFWDWASQVMHEHSDRKAELEIQFDGEDGTGIGPTLEFFSMLAAEIRRRDGLMWVVDDRLNPTSSRTDQVAEDELEAALSRQLSDDSAYRPAMPTAASIGSLTDSRSSLNNSTDHQLQQETSAVELEASSYVDSTCGLFPVPWPGDKVPNQVLHRFYILGITLGKCLQDNRRIDLPLSVPFLKLLSSYGSLPQSMGGATDLSEVREILATVLRPGATDCAPVELSLSPRYRRLVSASDADRCCWLNHLLDLDDFCLIYPQRAQFMRELAEFCRRKRSEAVEEEKSSSRLACDIFGSTFEDMCLTMEFVPPTKTLGYTSAVLCDSYTWESSTVGGVNEANSLNSPSTDVPDVTADNAEAYLMRTLEFCLDKGIRKQMDAFRAGFERVLALDWLALFTCHDLGQLIAGDSVARWTRDELTAYTVPAFGYNRQSPVYRMLINVLCNFSLAERRAFLQFTTGCSSLPPGGLKNLHPRLRIVRKDDDARSYPSVNTCVHYLKLPEYKSEAELRTALLAATREIGFYLN